MANELIITNAAALAALVDKTTGDTYTASEYTSLKKALQEANANTRAANTFLAGPTSGAAAQARYRVIDPLDIPVITSAKVSDFATAVGAILTTSYGVAHTWTALQTFDGGARVEGLGVGVAAPGTATQAHIPNLYTDMLTSYGGGGIAVSTGLELIDGDVTPAYGFANEATLGFNRDGPGVIGVAGGTLSISALSLSRAVVTDSLNRLASSATTAAEIGHLSGVTSAIQGQLDGKAASSHTHAATDITGVITAAQGGLGVALSPPVADRLLFYDQSAGAYAYLTPGSGLAITGTQIDVTAGGTGTVTSVDLSMPAQFSVSGNPVTTAGTLAVSWATQAANAVMVGPISGAAAVPTFRVLDPLDIPTLTAAKISDFNTAADARVAAAVGVSVQALDPDLTALAALSTTGLVRRTGVATFTASALVNADVDAAAAIAYSKLNLATSIVNADIAAGAAIAYSKLNLTGAVLDADIVAVAATKLTGTIADARLSSNVALLNAANAWADGVKQTFNPNATTAGINVGAQAGDPSALADGDVWYDSTGGLLRARINGVSTSLGTGGGGSAPFIDSTAIIKGSADATKLVRIEADGLTTATTRVWTAPDADITLPGVNVANTWASDQTFSGQILGKAGTAASPTLCQSGTTNMGLFFESTSFIGLTFASTQAFRFAANAMKVVNGVGFSWSSTGAITGAADSGLARDAAGTMRITNGSTGIGALLTNRMVAAKTSNYPVTATDAFCVFTNEGAAGAVTFTLPTAVAGYTFTFYVQAAQTFNITAAAGDTIRNGSSVTAAAGTITSSTVGTCITLQAINATEWVATAVLLTWT